ncbi:hypothetical protein DAKH74_010270, partial [Maudiozyma humilis]
GHVLVDEGLRAVLVVVGQPGDPVELVCVVRVDGVVEEDVGDVHLVPLLCELVCDEQGVVEVVAEVVGEQHEYLVVTQMLSSDVGVDAKEVDVLTGGGALVVDALEAAFLGRIGGHGKVDVGGVFCSGVRVQLNNREWTD